MVGDISFIAVYDTYVTGFQKVRLLSDLVLLLEDVVSWERYPWICARVSCLHRVLM